MKVRERTRYLTQDEETRLLEALPAGVKREAIAFLLDTGARVNEALGLTWEDMRHHASLDRVTFYRTKNGRARTVPLTTRAQEILKTAQRETRHKPFPCRYHALHVAFNKAKRTAGLGSDVVIHSLRHTCASRLVQRGATLQKVQIWLGHSDISMTTRYSHLAPDALDGLTGLLEQAS